MEAIYSTDQNWINNNTPLFKAWVWGGEYGTGQWVDVQAYYLEETGITALYCQIYESAEKMILVRFDPNTEVPMDWPDSLNSSIWNKTGEFDPFGELNEYDMVTVLFITGY